ncbi:MAG: hypothetical protein AAF478_08790 [Pseudomonadota bacterium]
MYGNDTFFHLSQSGQIGLAILSGMLGIATLWLFNKTSSRFGVLVKVLLAIVFLWGFTWLSPQIYYLYYWLIFDTLPFQNVIKSPPSLADIFRLSTFTADTNLSDHSKGILFWLMIGFTIWKFFKVPRQDRG